MNKINLKDLKEIAITSTKSTVASVHDKNTVVKPPKVDSRGFAYATGKRKNSIARVWMKRGSGTIKVNNKSFDSYFSRDCLKKHILNTISLCDLDNKIDILCTIKGGGLSGQSGALHHGVAKAIDCLIPELHYKLKSNKLLTRDSRVVERKKYGQHKARKKTQFSKR